MPGVPLFSFFVSQNRIISSFSSVTIGAEALKIAYAVVPGFVQRDNVINLVIRVYKFFTHLTSPLGARSNNLFCPVRNLAPVRAAKVATEQGVVVG